MLPDDRIDRTPLQVEDFESGKEAKEEEKEVAELGNLLSGLSFDEPENSKPISEDDLSDSDEIDVLENQAPVVNIEDEDEDEDEDDIMVVESD
jgi:hypothetical protein